MEVLIKLSDAIKTLKSMAVPLVRKLPSAQPERLTDYSFEESCTECPAYDTENHRCPRFNQVIRTALKDANLEPCENCISRQAAIDVAKQHWYKPDIAKALEELPSAQPEIIHCGDCKYFELDHFEKVDGFPIPIIVAHEICMKWSGGCRTSIDGWCFMAERRTDETD